MWLKWSIWRWCGMAAFLRLNNCRIPGGSSAIAWWVCSVSMFLYKHILHKHWHDTGTPIHFSFWELLYTSQVGARKSSRWFSENKLRVDLRSSTEISGFPHWKSSKLSREPKQSLRHSWAAIASFSQRPKVLIWNHFLDVLHRNTVGKRITTDGISAWLRNPLWIEF